eukprot:3514861-Prymnesium_polylepis.1
MLVPSPKSSSASFGQYTERTLRTSPARTPGGRYTSEGSPLPSCVRLSGLQWRPSTTTKMVPSSSVSVTATSSGTGSTVRIWPIATCQARTAAVWARAGLWGGSRSGLRCRESRWRLTVRIAHERVAVVPDGELAPLDRVECVVHKPLALLEQVRIAQRRHPRRHHLRGRR